MLPSHTLDAERFLPWGAIKQLSGDGGGAAAGGGGIIALQQLLVKGLLSPVSVEPTTALLVQLLEKSSTLVGVVGLSPQPSSQNIAAAPAGGSGHQSPLSGPASRRTTQEESRNSGAWNHAADIVSSNGGTSPLRRLSPDVSLEGGWGSAGDVRRAGLNKSGFVMLLGDLQSQLLVAIVGLLPQLHHCVVSHLPGNAAAPTRQPAAAASGIDTASAADVRQMNLRRCAAALASACQAFHLPALASALQQLSAAGALNE